MANEGPYQTIKELVEIHNRKIMLSQINNAGRYEGVPVPNPKSRRCQACAKQVLENGQLQVPSQTCGACLTKR